MIWKMIFFNIVFLRYSVRFIIMVLNWMRIIIKNGLGIWFSDSEEVMFVVVECFWKEIIGLGSSGIL